MNVDTVYEKKRNKLMGRDDETLKQFGKLVVGTLLIGRDNLEL